MAFPLRSLLTKLIGTRRRGAVASRTSPPAAQCPLTVDQFATLIVKSQIWSESEASAAAKLFAAECRRSKTPPRVESFCDFLVASNRLTAWQCDKLRAAKWKGFYLDQYLLLEHVGKDSVSSSYRARDTRDGKLVVLAVTPRNRMDDRTDGRIEYRVYPYL